MFFWFAANGNKLVHKVDLKFNRGSLNHDMGVTKQLIKFCKGNYARIGVMPRYGDANSVKWFDIEPHCMFHILNFFEDGDEIVVRRFRSVEAIIPGPDFGSNKFECFSKGFKPMSTSEAGTTKYGKLAKLYLDEPPTRPSKEDGLVKVEYHNLDENTFCSGAVFVPKDGSLEEDDGWITSFVHNEETNISQVWYLSLELNRVGL
ncbi:hypothetical protein GIB67_010177 [Kingdonia uniflora]|uniref:Uncharacterized protein n=1 Tax=Kingdonia uniflora TaxID=39325 RepID=A0A7J7NAN9_9MAGN|nr:hypothetical protein GIB67_010177 [Kingdonia uniflora]